ncbi:hypothetical protein I79_026096 [Cricetulus griseus]|uniref:Uncharacterized protein n=1 Tax=Cricetulus griseus TaxID=10029 RepID=G3IQ11_CRIGR|nr:hypothetical protein I79_026096 [Cricetulus griseus]
MLKQSFPNNNNNNNVWFEMVATTDLILPQIYLVVFFFSPKHSYRENPGRR